MSVSSTHPFSDSLIQHIDLLRVAIFCRLKCSSNDDQKCALSQIFDRITFTAIECPNKLPYLLKDQLSKIDSMTAQSTNPIEYKQLSRISEKMKVVLDQIPFPKPLKIKPPALHIEEHNQKAPSMQQFLKAPSEKFLEYPTDSWRKIYFQNSRQMVSSIYELAPYNPSFRTLLFATNTKLRSSSAAICCAQGQCMTMKDRYIAKLLSLESNGQEYEAEVFCIFDGRGSTEAVSAVEQNLISLLELYIETRLKEKNINADDLFYPFKEAFTSMHLELESLNLKGGSTAVVVFKFSHLNEFWVANFGDSGVYLNRRGKPIPMNSDKQAFNKDYAQYTFEIFRQETQKDELLIMHSRGVKAGMQAVVNIVEEDKNSEVPRIETAKCLVQANIPLSNDNVSVMLIDFKRNS